MNKRDIAYGAGLTAAGFVGLLTLEALIARSKKYARPAFGLDMRGGAGPHSARSLHLVLLGDSTAAGVGVDRFPDTVGGQLAHLLAVDGRRIDVSSVAISGTRSAELATQVSRALLGNQPDAALILVGANDVFRPARLEPAIYRLGTAVRRLRQADVPVVVGTCPDLGAIRSIPQPLRAIIGQRGRRFSQAQQTVVREAGGIAVDLAAETGVLFRADKGTVCWDNCHPSADGYRLWAHALAPAIEKALQPMPA